MTKEQEINSKIIELTMHIREKYPELYTNLGEMTPLDSDGNRKIDIKELNDYYDSLKKMIKNHLQQHTHSDHRLAVQPINSDKFLFMQTIKEHRKSVTGIVLKYGIISAICFVVIFFISKALGVEKIVELRFINLVALFIISGLAIKSFMTRAETKIRLSEGLVIGFFTALVGYLIFSLFLLLYFRFLDEGLADYLKTNSPLGTNFNPMYASVYVLFEGITFGVVIAFILMQHYRDYTPPSRD